MYPENLDITMTEENVDLRRNPFASDHASEHKLDDAEFIPLVRCLFSHKTTYQRRRICGVDRVHKSPYSSHEAT